MTKAPDPDEVLATIHASAPRRWLGVGTMTGLGVLLIYIALARPPALGWALFLIAIGAGSLWLASKMYTATSRVIELTRLELRDSTGAVIAPVAEIDNVDRGFFAFKPSNGFLLRTTRPTGPRVWLPGMWWRMGRQIGIGGVTPGAQTKYMTELLAALMAERDGKI
jgi:hypothetical protein